MYIKERICNAGSIAVEKFTGYGELLEGTGFTLYEYNGTGDTDSENSRSPVTQPENWTTLKKDRIRAAGEFKRLDVTKKYKLKETTVPEGYSPAE